MADCRKAKLKANVNVSFFFQQQTQQTRIFSETHTHKTKPLQCCFGNVLFSCCAFLQVGDEILEINGRSTENIPHADAIALIKSGGNKVRLLIHRHSKPAYLGR